MFTFLEVPGTCRDSRVDEAIKYLVLQRTFAKAIFSTKGEGCETVKSKLPTG